MQLTVTTIIFGLPTGQRTSHVRLTLPVATLTIHELIAYKVRQEVEEVFAHQRSNLSGEYRTPEELLGVTPSAPHGTTGTALDEIARAQQAFSARTYMIVVNNQRVWEPDTLLTLHPETQVEFIKILPLVGG
jgi:hypothetical protein